MNSTSVSLLERLHQPESERAWSRFVELYTPLIYHWSRGIGLSQDQAEDLVQDVFAALLKELPKFQYDPAKSFRGWLRTVTLNRCRDFLRRQSRSPHLTEDGRLDPSSPADDSFAEDEYRRRLVARALDIMQTEFEPNTWQACWQAVVEGRQPADIAEELGLTVNAVYLAKSRVLRRLRHELQGLLD